MRHTSRLVTLLATASVGCGALAQSSPPSTSNVGAAEGPATGLPAPTKGATNLSTSAHAARPGDAKAAPGVSNSAPIRPKGSSLGPAEEGVRGVPPNDACSNAIALNIGDVFFGDTVGATAESPEPPFCGTSLTVGGVWFTFVGDGSELAITTCGAGTTYDSKIYVYTGTCGSLVCVAGNDDTCGLRAQVTISTIAGETYRVLVAGFSTGQGDFQLSIGIPAPIDIDCVKGDVIEGEFESGNGCGIPVDTFNGGCNSAPEVYSVLDCGETVCGSAAFDGVTRDTDWYRISFGGPGVLTWTIEEAAFDWQLYIVDLTNGCDDLVIVGAASGPAGTSGFAQGVSCGGVYALVVAPSFTNPVGCPSHYRASVMCEEVIFPEFGDCPNPIALDVPSSVSGSSVGTNCYLQPRACGTSVDGSGLWFSVEGTGTTITASLCSGTDYDSKLYAYCGDGCDALFCVAGNDDFCGVASQISFCSVVGQTYRIFLGGFAGAQGNFQLDISEDGVACDGAGACEPIVINCQKGDIAEGEFESSTEYGCGVPADFYNGGCNSVPEVFSPIECGQIVCGTGAFDGVTRDTDWYTITVAEPTQFTWTLLESSFDWVLFIIDASATCGALVIFDTEAGPAGTSGSVFYSFGPGTYLMFVAPNFTSPVDCPSGYRAQLTCAGPCTLTCDGSPVEGETDCGIPVDTFNGGCNSTPPVFSEINGCSIICGTAAFDGVVRDTDWFVLDTTGSGQDVVYTFEVTAEFPFVAGYVEWQPGFEGSGDCARTTGLLNPFMFGPGDCAPHSISVSVGDGIHWFFVAPQSTGLLSCTPGSRNNYTVDMSCEICDCGDCNENGITDSEEIASGLTSDCFDYSAPAGTRGGPNGIPDDCECVADWNRDGIANSTDVSDFINTYFADQVSGGSDGDINCDGVTNSTDVSDFINIWFAAQAGQLPYAGCTI